MSRKAICAAVLLSGLVAAGSCSSNASKKDSGLGKRVLDCVVVQRDHDAPGSGGSSYQGTGNYYLVFETREGQATSRYRFEVTRQQWFRFTEGARVRITLSNNILLDIRPGE